MHPFLARDDSGSAGRILTTSAEIPLYRRRMEREWIFPIIVKPGDVLDRASTELAPQRFAQILHRPRERIHFAFQFPGAIACDGPQLLLDRFYAPTGAAHL